LTPVRQTRFGFNGNCMNACIASILDLAIETVPYPLNDDEKFLDTKLNEWLATLGFAYIEFPWGPMVLAPDIYCIASGPAARGFDHAVVAQTALKDDGTVTVHFVHDPPPGRFLPPRDQDARILRPNRLTQDTMTDQAILDILDRHERGATSHDVHEGCGVHQVNTCGRPHAEPPCSSKTCRGEGSSRPGGPGSTRSPSGPEKSTGTRFVLPVPG